VSRPETAPPDVLVVGAGPAGSALAYHLASRGHHVLLLDKSDFPRDKTCGDCLSPRALRALKRMGLLETFEAACFRVNHALVFPPSGPSLLTPIPSSADTPGYALVLPRPQLDDLLRRCAVGAGAVFRSGLHVTDVVWSGGLVTGVRATSPDGPVELRARLVVLATGASTTLPQRAGLLPRPAAFARAARTYYEGMGGLSDALEIHLHSVLLPGYGWVFPISPTAANVGAGNYVPSGRRPPVSPRQTLDAFLASDALAGRLAGAQSTGPVRAYPLRLDFPTARTARPGLALVGEACGLVNPLTGEGIDYALESAEVAADVLGDGLRRGASPEGLAARYSRALRDRFLRSFVSYERVRVLFGRRWMLNHLIAAASRNEELRVLFVQVALGNVNPYAMFSPRTLLRVALG
jgi:geranylgeranyl reductase family protein